MDSIYPAIAIINAKNIDNNAIPSISKNPEQDSSDK
jgi:hypothetical protein